MRFKQTVKFEHGLKPLHIIPFITTTFLLIIFFLLASLFISRPGIGIKFPKTLTSEVTKEENLIVTITSEDVMYLNGVVVTLKELRAQLNRSKNQKQSLLVKADRRASLRRIFDLWDLCRNLGIEKINIATNQDK